MAAERAGYTLLEILTVVVLIGLVGGLGVGAIARLLRDDPIFEAQQAIIAQGNLARLLAADQQGIRLRLESNGWRADANANDIAPLRLPGSVQVVWQDDNGNIVDDLQIDRRGRSADILITVREDRRQSQWLWLGVTGEMVERAAKP